MMDPEQAMKYTDAVYDDNEPPKKPRRVVLLNEGAHLTAGDRNADYGEPYENLTGVAALMTAYIVGKYRGTTLDENTFSLTAEDIAWLNVMQKAARTFGGRVKSDNYIDAATYAAIAGECAEVENS